MPAPTRKPKKIREDQDEQSFEFETDLRIQLDNTKDLINCTVKWRRPEDNVPWEMERITINYENADQLITEDSNPLYKMIYGFFQDAFDQKELDKRWENLIKPKGGAARGRS